MNQDTSASAPGASAQAARELAYRRWRPGPAVQPASGGDTSAASPASALAHRRWGTEPKVSPSPAPTAPGSGGFSDGENLAIAAALAALAWAIYQDRKKQADPNRGPSASPATTSRQPQPSPAPEETWRPWLAGGSILAAALLLIFSASARRSWGAIVAAEALLLAVTWPL